MYAVTTGYCIHKDELVIQAAELDRYSRERWRRGIDWPEEERSRAGTPGVSAQATGTGNMKATITHPYPVMIQGREAIPVRRLSTVMGVNMTHRTVVKMLAQQQEQGLNSWHFPYNFLDDDLRIFAYRLDIEGTPRQRFPTPFRTRCRICGDTLTGSGPCSKSGGFRTGTAPGRFTASP